MENSCTAGYNHDGYVILELLFTRTGFPFHQSSSFVSSPFGIIEEDIALKNTVQWVCEQTFAPCVAPQSGQMQNFNATSGFTASNFIRV